jgi:hypothetical protein
MINKIFEAKVKCGISMCDLLREVVLIKQPFEVFFCKDGLGGKNLPH